MTWSARHAWSVGEVLTAANHNNNDADLDFLGPPDAVSSPGMWMLYDSTAGGSVASFDITSISQLYKHLRVVTYLRDDSVGTQDGVARIRFNNDTGATYDYLTATMSTTYAGTQSTGQTSGAFTGEVNGGATANRFAAGEGIVLAYTQTTGQKTYVSWSFNSTTGGTQNERHNSGNWASTAAINRITIFPNTGSNFVAGSRVTLYGVA